MLDADPSKVSLRAKKRGLPQVKIEINKLEQSLIIYLHKILHYS